MTRDYMDMSPALIVFDHYLRQTITVADEYMTGVRRLRALELLGLVDLAAIKGAHYDCAMCELEAARCLVGRAYTRRLIDAADFYTINKMLNQFGRTIGQEVKK